MQPGMCKHFNGTWHNKTCRAGVAYADVTPEPERKTGIALRVPCRQKCEWTNPSQLAEFNKRGTCPKYEEPTAEDLAENNRRREAAMQRMRLTFPLIEKVKQEHRGQSWQGVEQCPACGGKLHLSHAATNGHVWGRCETEGCTSWME
jgi:hypothetical protein